MSSYQPGVPLEDVNRGTVVALLALPVGVIVWVLIWSLGFIASIVTLGVAYLAMFLYRLGSGGTMGRAGAIRVAVITLVTLVVAIIAGLIVDVAVGIGSVTGVGPIEALASPVFGDVFSAYISDPESGLLLSLGVAIAFGLLGCFSVLRSAFSAAANPTPTFQAPGYPPLSGGQFPGQQFPEQQYPQQPFAGQQYPGQQFPAQQYPGQQFPAQQYPAQQFPAQQFPAQSAPGQPFPPPAGPAQPQLGEPIPGIPQFPSQVQPTQPIEQQPPVSGFPPPAAPQFPGTEEPPAPRTPRH